MERRVARLEHGLQKLHLLESFCKENVETTAPINQYPVEAGVIDGWTKYERKPSQLGQVIRVIGPIEGDRDL